MFEDTMHALRHAEEAVLEAQGHPGSAEFQQAVQRLHIAKDHIAYTKTLELNDEQQHRLSLASERLVHLQQTMESLED
ncbi:hypothetical protein [Metabacillus sp. 84]|uniref:hypothetical protein n=1 Tax=unclassified Metabacillus TaxID=2675274 RepID=UPI003CE98B4B